MTETTRPSHKEIWATPVLRKAETDEGANKTDTDAGETLLNQRGPAS